MTEKPPSSPTIKLRDALSSRILDGVSLPMVVVDLDSKIRVFNKAAVRLFGKSEEELFNLALETALPELQALVASGAINSVLAGEGRREVESVEIIDEESNALVFEFHIDPLIDSKDRTYAATITGLDVTDLEVVKSQLRRQNEQLLALHTVSTVLRQSFDLRKTLFIIVTALTSVRNPLFEHAVIFLAENEDRLRGTMAARSFDPDDVGAIWSLLKGDQPFKRLMMTQFPSIYDQVRKLSRIVRRIRIPVDGDKNNAVLTAASERRTITNQQGGEWRLPASIERALGVPSFAVTPLMAEGTLLGVLLAICPEQEKEVGEEAIRVLEMLADQAAVAITSGIAYQRIHDRAQRDSLTGLYNHGYLMSRMHDEIARAKRYSLTFGVLMIDIDHFKQLNDAHGHQVGDEVLLKLSDLMQHTARESDICARYGGEEFAIVLPSAGEEDSEAFAERLRVAIESAVLARDNNGERIPVTAAIGVSVYPNHGKTEDELIAKADLALYTAKRQGRNRVSVAR